MSPQEIAWLYRDSYEYALDRVATFNAAGAYAKWYVEEYGAMEYEAAPYQRRAFGAWQAGLPVYYSWTQKGFGCDTPT